MPSELPIVFLAFANSLDDHLATLKDESRDIFRKLQPLQNDNRIFIHREESSEFDELYQDLLAYDDRIVIFHYGGHADGATLTLEGGGGGAGGIAGLLGQQSSLKLVFLNGCATKDQVKLLHAAGVPAVIATSVKINDSRATQFSTAFYAALAQGNSIFEAFDSASNYIEGKFGSDGSSGIVINRFPNFDHEEEDTTPEVFEWALYSKKHAARDLEQWRLPEAREDWQIQLEDTRGPLRDLDGNPQLIEHRSRSRTVDAIPCNTCSSISAVVGQTTSVCPVCGATNEPSENTTQVPEFMVPFVIDHDEAIRRVHKHSQGTAPSAINVTAVHVPYWLFDVHAHVKLTADRGWNRKLEQIMPKLEWEPFRSEWDVAFESYLLPGGKLPPSGEVKARDWYWELGKAEPVTQLPSANSFIVHDRPVQVAFGELVAHLEDELESEVALRVGGHEKRNVVTETTYRGVSARTLFLPLWFAQYEGLNGKEYIQVNGQTGAVRPVTLAAVTDSKDRSAFMDERTFEPKSGPRQTSYASSVYGAIGIGLMVGWLIGFSESETVGLFIGAVGTALAAVLGLNDRHFSMTKGLRIGSFGLAVVIAAPTAIYIRDHGLLTPQQLPPPTNAQRLNEYIDLGFHPDQALEMVGQKIAVDVKQENTHGEITPSVLHTNHPTDLSVCTSLEALEVIPSHSSQDVIDSFDAYVNLGGETWKKWGPLIEGLDELEDESQKSLLFLARDTDCVHGLFRSRVTISEQSCNKLKTTDESTPSADLAQLLPEAHRDQIMANVQQGITSKDAGKGLRMLMEFLCR